MQTQFKRFFSFDSPKAIKAAKYRYLNGINYMSPHESGGAGNLCPKATPACISLCLGLYSGQASMVPEGGTNNVRESRKRKAQFFMGSRQTYMLEALWHIAQACRAAKRKRLKLAIRPNGSTDIAYEGLRVMITPEYAAQLSKISGHAVPHGAQTIFSAFPRVQMLDYTKIARRFDRSLPANYYLTFSRAENNESEALSLLARGHNVAVVFAGKLPRTWNGYRVIDGDLHDLRHLDPRGVVVGLLPKGNKAKKDQSGFVVR